MTDGPIPASTSIGFIDGAFMPLADLQLPVSDLGFQLSDVCYDTVHVWDGAFFRLPDHLDRWERSVAARRFDSLPYDREGVAEVLHDCVARTDLREAMVTVVATRGSPTGPHKDLRTCRNRLLAWAQPYYSVVSERGMIEGCDIIVSETRRIPPGAVDPTVKNFGRLDFVAALFEAYDRNASYALLVDGEGHVTEGRGWNLFTLHGGRLTSPGSGVLEGITRRTVLELAEQLNIDTELTPVPVEAVRSADEVFLTSTAGGIVPVRSVDAAPIADGCPGPVTARLRELYWALHDDPGYRTEVHYSAAGKTEPTARP